MNLDTPIQTYNLFLKPAHSNMDAAPLVCPMCQGDNIHQSGVEIFDRKEDARDGQHVRVVGNDHLEENIIPYVTVDRQLDGNPSDRRQGLFIPFWCESCHEKPVLSIYQHKGSTYMHWGE